MPASKVQRTWWNTRVEMIYKIGPENISGHWLTIPAVEEDGSISGKECWSVGSLVKHK